ncbi:MAG: arsenate reductase ArsC [Chloroflexi bacterium]|nr:arsenate reductase ArsC [Chloroflexota bacterium]
MKKVLFVCVHNAGRSQMAKAFFNRLAKGKAKALSAGTSPSDAVDPTVVSVMKEIGIDISGVRPKALTPEMLGQVDRVVTMGCSVGGICPATFVETEDWGLEDPKGKPLEKVREIRDEVRARVLKLLEESGI